MQQQAYHRNFDAETGHIQNPNEVQPFVRFYVQPIQNNFKSKEEGRPIFEDKEWVEIRFPGDTKTVIEREVKEEDKARFAMAYAAFKNGQEPVLEGTPLAEWPEMTRSQVEEFGAMQIRTVEQLAALSDTFAQNIRFGGVWVKKAQDFLEGHSKAEAAKAEAEEKNAALEAQVAAMQKEIDSLKAAQDTKPAAKAPPAAKSKAK